MKHCQSLKRKLVSKQRRKLALSTQTVAVDVEVSQRLLFLMFS